MRTPSRSCVLLFLAAAFTAGCEKGAARDPVALQPAKTALMDGAAYSSSGDAVKLAESLKNGGATDDALAVLQEAHRRFPEDTKILSAYGRLALIIGKDALASSLLEKAVNADPDDWRALSAKAVLDRRQGRLEAAHRALLRADTLSGGHPAVINNLGMSYLLSGDVERAETQFRKALIAPGLNPSYRGRLKQNLAVALAVKGEFDAADQVAGEAMPRKLKNAKGKEIAAYMGLGGNTI